MSTFTDYLTAKEVAERLKVSVFFVHRISAPRQLKEHRLPAHYFGSRKRFRWDEVEVFFNERSKGRNDDGI
jgi:excisionase family DNA binding protein